MLRAGKRNKFRICVLRKIQKPYLFVYVFEINI